MHTELIGLISEQRFMTYATHSISHWQLSATGTRQPTLVDRHLQSADIRSLAALNHRHQAAYLGGQAPSVSRYWSLAAQLSTTGTRQSTLVDGYLQSAGI